MNCLALILALAIAVVASGPADKPAELDFSCTGICAAECNIEDSACRLLPGQEENCGRIMSACTVGCRTSCRCLDRCSSRCDANTKECNPDNSVVDAILCYSTNQQCQFVCPLSCGFKAGSDVVNFFIEFIQSQFPTIEAESS